jgi:Resolvase, N terminal domain
VSQRKELEAWAERAGHTVVKVYEDQGISGAQGRDKRPAFDALLKAAVPPRICRPGCALTLLVFLRHPPNRLVGNLVAEMLTQVVEKLAQTRGVKFALLVPQSRVAGACNSDSQ